MLTRVTPPPPPAYVVLEYRPLRDSSIREFGQWVTGEGWETITRLDDADEAAAALEDLLRTRFEQFIPIKRTRVRALNKPWITPNIVALMKRRRQAWHRGRVDRWRDLHHDIKLAIRDAKRDAAQSTRKTQLTRPNLPMESERSWALRTKA